MENAVFLSPSDWQDYELLDSGGYEKLERFGSLVTIRPEPQALWQKSLADGEWEKLAGAVFRRAEGRRDADRRDAGRRDFKAGDGGKGFSDRRGFTEKRAFADERGEWDVRDGVDQQWAVGYSYKDMSLKMRLGLTAFKHVGIFPEQARNWDFIYDNVKAMSVAGGDVRVLNLFAYTGGASLAAAAGGAAVTHVDSVKQVVGWARENAERSGLDGIRWIVDDAAKFVAREVRRGSLYNGIVLDPPAYGRGPDGEKWVLEQHLPALLEDCRRLLVPGRSFIVLNLYSMGLSSLLARTAVRDIVGSGLVVSAEESGELFFADRAGRQLPLGVFYRAVYG